MPLLLLIPPLVESLLKNKYILITRTNQRFGLVGTYQRDLRIKFMCDDDVRLTILD